jgi:hypothetical protein
LDANTCLIASAIVVSGEEWEVERKEEEYKVGRDNNEPGRETAPSTPATTAGPG